MAGETAPWRILVDEAALRDLKRLTPKDQARVRVAIDGLTAGLHAGDIKKLHGRQNEWRLRVGDWRVIFRPDFSARVIFVLHVHPRGSAYRG